MTRLAQIMAFKAELMALAEEGITLDEATLSRIRAHHESLLTGTPDERLSIGMRLASFVGAVALSCAVFFLFYRIWGALGVGQQVAILVAAPLLLVGATHALHRWERTGYFAALAALAAFAAFILELVTLGQIFNLPATPHAFLAYGLFGVLLGWSYGLRLPHFAGLAGIGLWITALPGTLRHELLPELFTRGEALLVAGAFLLLLPRFESRVKWHVDHRIVGMVGLFLGLFVLSISGRQSWLPWDHDLVEGFYQVVSFAVGGAVVYWGVRERTPDLANGGMIFLTAMCLFKATDWWWDWMPRWLFFLVLAGLAIGVMLGLRRIRTATAGGAR
ncbi:MAG TPA: DUF2157 domain-containing protein [Gemmatimonadales bacterium]|nr:DUF2157 domain-containing protein [Gemmatimonadales bacterium]